jgi:hypothetical protein
MEADVAMTGPPLMTASKLPLGQPRPLGGSGQVFQSALPLGGQSDQLPAPPLHVDVVCARSGFDRNVSDPIISDIASRMRGAVECVFAIFPLEERAPLRIFLPRRYRCSPVANWLSQENRKQLLHDDLLHRVRSTTRKVNVTAVDRADLRRAHPQR